MSRFVRTNDSGARPSCCPYCESAIPFNLYATCGGDSCLAMILNRGQRAPSPQRPPSRDHDPIEVRSDVVHDAASVPAPPGWHHEPDQSADVAAVVDEERDDSDPKGAPA